jgi:hypothetical protein
MRTLDYTLLPPVGDVETATRGSVAALLRDVPYLLIGGLIPPLLVINEVLRQGVDDAGMSGGCRWDPFEITQSEFAEIVSELEAHGDRDGKPLQYEEPPDWVATRSDWGIWVGERVYSIPAEESRRLSAEMAEVEKAMNEAAARGDEDARIEHLCRLSELGAEMSDFILRHRKPSYFDDIEEDDEAELEAGKDAGAPS